MNPGKNNGIGKQFMRTLGLSYILLLLLIQPEAGARDTHALWDDRCEECHGHAGEFARKFLWVFDDQLQGQHHVKDLRLFMRNHYIPQHEIEAVYNMLLAQANTPARFKSECKSCHDSASAFIRKSIFAKAGELTGAKSGIPVREFLATHRELTQDDVEFFTKLLTRVAAEVYGP